MTEFFCAEYQRCIQADEYNFDNVTHIVSILMKICTNLTCNKYVIPSIEDNQV